MKENQPNKLLIFPDIARFSREPKLPPSRKIIPIRREGKIIDFEQERKKRRPMNET